MSRKRILLERCGPGKDHFFFHPNPKEDEPGYVDANSEGGGADDPDAAPDLGDDTDDGLEVTDGEDSAKGGEGGDTIDPAFIDGISPGLWCSIRVHLVNEVRMDGEMWCGEGM
jgi:hypothetical protein